MPWWSQLLISLASGLLLTWMLLVLLLVRSGRGRPDLAGAMRMLPDVVRLISRLARDHSLPRGVRVRLWLLLAYLASPIDLVPDFVPIAGYADDAILVAITLRSVVRRAGSDALAALARNGARAHGHTAPRRCRRAHHHRRRC